jgi:hypothetical protein
MYHPGVGQASRKVSFTSVGFLLRLKAQVSTWHLYETLDITHTITSSRIRRRLDISLGHTNSERRLRPIIIGKLDSFCWRMPTDTQVID